jgi:hypothetical protein
MPKQIILEGDRLRDFERVIDSIIDNEYQSFLDWKNDEPEAQGEHIYELAVRLQSLFACQN